MSGQADVATRVERLARGADLAWVADALTDRRDEIIRRWRDVAGRQPFHQGRKAPAVADHIPDLFDALVAVLQRTAPASVPSEAPLDDPIVLEAAKGHARVRFEQGLQAADVVTEFRLLRQEIGRALRVEVDDDAPTSDVVGAELLVHDALDGAISLALNALTVHVEEMREEFLATTIHDVQQPITAIKGNVQLARRQLARDDLDVARVTAVLLRVEAEANRMALLLGVLSDVSRLALGRLEPNPEPANLAELAEALVERLDSDAQERVQVIRADSDDLSGTWDSGMIERVVANLVSNALKYSLPRAPVLVRVAAMNGSVHLSVQDQGIGLSADELPRLFRRYGRAGGALAAGVEGLGLGLYLSKSIVEAHGGRIYAESAGPGCGTTVHVVLPRSIEQPEAD